VVDESIWAGEQKRRRGRREERDGSEEEVACAFESRTKWGRPVAVGCARRWSHSGVTPETVAGCQRDVFGSLEN